MGSEEKREDEESAES